MISGSSAIISEFSHQNALSSLMYEALRSERYTGNGRSKHQLKFSWFREVCDHSLDAQMTLQAKEL